VDPKIFRADMTWLVFCVGCSRLLRALRTKCTPERAHAATAACHVATVFLDGSRSLGLKEKEAAMMHELVTGDTSLRASAEALSSSELHDAYPTLQKAAKRLAQVIDPESTSAVDVLYDSVDDDGSDDNDDDVDDVDNINDDDDISTGNADRAGILTGLQVHDSSAIYSYSHLTRTSAAFWHR